MDLNEIYGPLRTQILTMEPMPSIGNVYSLIQQDERQKNIFLSSSQSDNASVLISCSHSYLQCGNECNKDKSNITYDYCNGSDHERNNCFELHGYPS